MWRVLREHVKGFERACGGLREKVLQSCKASTAENMKFSGKKIIAIKSDNILPYFKANLFLYQTLPLRNFCQNFGKKKNFGQNLDFIEFWPKVRVEREFRPNRN